VIQFRIGKQDKQFHLIRPEFDSIFFLWRMKTLDEIRGMDVYLLDQFLKGRVSESSRILDAGCGSGRNLHYLINNGITVIGCDENADAIEQLRANYPQISDRFQVSSIENFSSNLPFDFIICNAVLHFARDHAHFDQLFSALVNQLAPNGILFIRMTSDIGLYLEFEGSNGVFLLPDGSTRYLITRKKIDELLRQHALQLLEPVKTVKVEELRSMSTLVFVKH
jgi:tellurite methyltransferase